MLEMKLQLEIALGAGAGTEGTNYAGVFCIATCLLVNSASSLIKEGEQRFEGEERLALSAFRFFLSYGKYAPNEEFAFWSLRQLTHSNDDFPRGYLRV